MRHGFLYVSEGRISTTNVIYLQVQKCLNSLQNKHSTKGNSYIAREMDYIYGRSYSGIICNGRDTA